MDLDTKMTVLTFATGAIMALFGGAFYWLWRRGKKFNQALDQVARKLKLEVALHGYSAASWAKGKVNGHDISLRQTSRSTSKLGTGSQKYYLEYRVGIPLPGSVRIERAGKWQPTVVDHSGGGVRKTPIGEPSFDSVYDVWGAKKQALRGLKVPEVREAIEKFLAGGGMIENSEPGVRASLPAHHRRGTHEGPATAAGLGQPRARRAMKGGVSTRQHRLLESQFVQGRFMAWTISTLPSFFTA